MKKAGHLIFEVKKIRLNEKPGPDNSFSDWTAKNQKPVLSKIPATEIKANLPY